MWTRHLSCQNSYHTTPPALCPILCKHSPYGLVLIHDKSSGPLSTIGSNTVGTKSVVSKFMKRWTKYGSVNHQVLMVPGAFIELMKSSQSKVNFSIIWLCFKVSKDCSGILDIFGMILISVSFIRVYVINSSVFQVSGIEIESIMLWVLTAAILDDCNLMFINVAYNCQQVWIILQAYFVRNI